MIKVFRIKFIERVTTLVVGLLFLNMNFFLAEVVALDLHKDQKMIENVAKLIAGAATEEEKDLSQTQENGTNTIGGLDILLVIQSNHGCPPFLSNSLAYLPHDGAKPINHFKETVNPPPEA
jgi:hypothetical protein